MSDPIFANPRLAALYDPLDSDRSDLDLYVNLMSRFQARSVLDIGCGTGTFACTLANQGIDVVGVDPAEASLAVAMSKPGAERVRWIHSGVEAIPDVSVDLATMTGNVAQVFLGDAELTEVLLKVRDVLRPNKYVVFEVRNPEREAWLGWHREATESTTYVLGTGPITSWVELLDVALPFVSFRWTYEFERTGEILTSDSTIRFRPQKEIERALSDAGFELLDVLDAPDRPAQELVFIGKRSAQWPELEHSHAGSFSGW